MTKMNKGERDDLIRLIKQREKVAKTAAEQRSAQMLVEFEKQVVGAHAFAREEVWNAAIEVGQKAAKEAAEKLAAKAAELGIPEEFRPMLHFGWRETGSRAYDNQLNELRRLAKAEIEAVEKAAKLSIEMQSIAAQSEIVASGLISAAAVAFLESLPALETMMPTLNLEAIQRKLAERARQHGRHLSVVD